MPSVHISPWRSLDGRTHFSTKMTDFCYLVVPKAQPIQALLRPHPHRLHLLPVPIDQEMVTEFLSSSIMLTDATTFFAGQRGGNSERGQAVGRYLDDWEDAWQGLSEKSNNPQGSQDLMSFDNTDGLSH